MEGFSTRFGISIGLGAIRSRSATSPPPVASAFNPSLPNQIHGGLLDPHNRLPQPTRHFFRED
jgi:hypothetical protein